MEESKDAIDNNSFKDELVVSLKSLLLILIVLFVGATIFYYVEDWSYLDSVYFCVCTITTIGFGDLSPSTKLGRFLFVPYTGLCLGIAALAISEIGVHIYNQYTLRLRKLRKAQASLKAKLRLPKSMPLTVAAQKNRKRAAECV
eukprot:GCRY01005380.1.p1 GENE.GCRY01005380.1~~GCRY01005380.1.p1  ORF type:complete len:144 (+),score=20.07 GCRY01005380.1:114-545(+)